MSFGDNLKRLRRDKGWTQGELADKAGLKTSHIPKLENDSGDPKLSTLYKLMNAFECSADTLLMDSEKVGTDGLLKASLDRIVGLPESQKYVLMDIIDAYCMRNSLQSQFKNENRFKLILYRDKPKSLIDEETLSKAIENQE